jgi:hypothetical protein
VNLRIALLPKALKLPNHFGSLLTSLLIELLSELFKLFLQVFHLFQLG